MESKNIPKLLTILLSIRSSIYDLFDESDRALTDAKTTTTGKILDSYFDNYRKDKLLKDCFIVFLCDIIKFIKSTSNYNIFENYTKLIILLSIIIDKYESIIGINKFGQSNNMTHFSTKGIMLTKSTDFIELQKIYKELYIFYEFNYNKVNSIVKYNESMN